MSALTPGNGHLPPIPICCMCRGTEFELAEQHILASLNQGNKDLVEATHAGCTRFHLIVESDADGGIWGHDTITSHLHTLSLSVRPTCLLGLHKRHANTVIACSHAHMHSRGVFQLLKYLCRRVLIPVAFLLPLRLVLQGSIINCCLQIVWTLEPAT